MWGQAAWLPALRCMRCDAPWARYTGLREQPADPRSGEVCKGDCDGGQVDRMVGVLRMAWRSGRCCHEGYAELQVTVCGRHGGMRGGTGVRIVGIPRTCSGTGEP